ncbi:hypothetical protein MP638_005882 [Amoeboaphelidium occidentale]|nr:hypothetical protein MP638_005882 [Amoeboaphelidium occidentale]
MKFVCIAIALLSIVSQAAPVKGITKQTGSRHTTTRTRPASGGAAASSALGHPGGYQPNPFAGMKLDQLGVKNTAHGTGGGTAASAANLRRAMESAANKKAAVGSSTPARASSTSESFKSVQSQTIRAKEIPPANPQPQPQPQPQTVAPRGGKTTAATAAGLAVVGGLAVAGGVAGAVTGGIALDKANKAQSAAAQAIEGAENANTPAAIIPTSATNQDIPAPDQPTQQQGIIPAAAQIQNIPSTAPVFLNGLRSPQLPNSLSGTLPPLNPLF